MSAAGSAIDAFVTRVGDLGTPFLIELPNGDRRRVGTEEPAFELGIRNERGLKALSTLDEGYIAEAYLRGDIDLEGDMLAPFSLRTRLADRHPLVGAWRFIQPFLFGQVHTNKEAIVSHYDIDPAFFLSFLDPIFPAYSQGVYTGDDEPLSKALERKFDWAIEKCEMGPGKTVLEIGPGWGAFAGHALQAGVHFTGITNSVVSKDFLEAKLVNFGDRFKIEFTDFLDYEPEEQFDSIVIMGVIEHLPQYERVIKKFYEILKPGGHVFLDGSSARKKYHSASFMIRHIYPGNHSFLVLDDLLNKIAMTPFELVEIHNDRWSYFLTFRQWARNLEANRKQIQQQFGDLQFRKFRLYLWGLTFEFLARKLDCYRMILRKPKGDIQDQIGEVVLITRDGRRRTI